MRRPILALLLTFSLLATYAQHTTSYRFPVRDVSALYAASFAEMRPNHFHSGIDIKTGGVEGKAVVAVADGYVVRMAVAPGGYGRVLYIAHNDGTTSVYAHLKQFRQDMESYLRYCRYRQGRSNIDIVCKPTQFPVHAGDTIALSGNSGASMGPHLHFELRESESQRTLNTLARGLFPVHDTTPPRLMRLHYVEIDTLRGIAQHARLRSYDIVVANGGGYQLRQTQPIAVGRKGYFIVECSDRKDQVTNTFGIYHIALSIDSVVCYEYRMDGFLFSDTRYCNAVSYYPLQLSSRNEVFRLTCLEGCPTQFYTQLKNRALLTTHAGERHQLHLVVEDECGNTSQLTFRTVGKPDEDCFRATAMSDTLPIVRYDRDFTHEQDGIRVSIPAGTLYESCFYRQRPSTLPRPNVSSIDICSSGVEILDVRTPLHSYATVSTDISFVPDSLRSHTVWASLSSKGVLRYEGGTLEGERLALSTRSLGTFYLVTDTVRPTLRPHFTEAELGRTSAITFSVRDNFSGIKSIACTIDGRMAIVEENRMKGTFTHYFDDEIFGRQRDHTLCIVVTDGAGNATTWKRTYRR